MRFFHYRGKDPSGRPAEGTIRAASAGEARQALTQAGYVVTAITDGPSGNAGQGSGARVAPAPTPVSAPRPAPRPVASQPVAVRAPSVRPQAPTASPVHAAASTAAPAVVHVKTPFGRDRDLFFLFSQLGSFYRSGITPVQALHNLAGKARHRYRASLQEAEKAVGEGRPLSAILEKYPYLYSPDVVGMVKAGEAAGHLPDACDRIADQKEASSRLKRRLSYFIFLIFGIVIAFPIAYAFVTGSIKSMEVQDKAGGTLPVNETIKLKVAEDLRHVAVPTVGVLALMIVGSILWHTMPVRELRHRLALFTPIIGGRIRAEATARLTWAMGMVSRGGLSPQQTFLLAAETVPNLILRKRYLDAARSMHEAERLSAAIKRSGSLPVEYAHIVETGEVTGDVPRAVSDIARATDADFRARDATAARLVSVLLYAMIGVVSLLMLIFLYRLLFAGYFKVSGVEDT